MAQEQPPRLILITGPMAAGTSTVAQAVAERLEPGVHLRGDVFRRMVVSGRVDMTAAPNKKALSQLKLRYRCAADVAQRCFQAGFNVVCQDLIVGPILTEVVAPYTHLPRQQLTGEKDQID